MTRQTCILLLLLTCKICKSQNLILNGDFEQYFFCPSNSGELDSVMFWQNPTAASPDYFNQCASSTVSIPNNFNGYQLANSGKAYGGIFLYARPPVVNNYREYLEIQLDSQLVKDTTYTFSMYINLSDNSKYTTDDVGVYFSDTVILIPILTNLSFIPQIINPTGNLPNNENWIKVNGSYKALGNEKFIIIGNFKNDTNTKVKIANSEGADFAYIYIDDVSLFNKTGIVNSNSFNEIIDFPNAFTPNRDGLNDNFKPIIQELGMLQQYDLKIFNRFGNMVFRTSLPNIGWDGLNNDIGTYFYLCSYKEFYQDSKIKKGEVLLLR